MQVGAVQNKAGTDFQVVRMFLEGVTKIAIASMEGKLDKEGAPKLG